MKKIILLLCFVPFITFSQVDLLPQGIVVDLEKAPKDLMKKFTIENDKFTDVKTIFHKKNDSNRLRLNIYIKKEEALLFLKTSYIGKDWIFLQSITFLVDNEKIEYPLKDVKRETMYGSGISETSGIYVDENLFKALEKISNTNSDVEVRYSGDKNNFDFKINKYMKQMINETLDFYKSIKL